MTWSKPGERVGLIKFGSRVDVFLGPEWDVAGESRLNSGRRRVERHRAHEGAE